MSVLWFFQVIEWGAAGIVLERLLLRVHPHGSIRPGNVGKLQDFCSQSVETKMLCNERQGLTQRAMLKRKRDDIPDPLDWRGTMRTSEAFRNHNDNFTEKVGCARQPLMQYLFME